MCRYKLSFMVISMSCCFLVFFFFFQAEDGIRDIGVTGVQTCALPIYADGVAFLGQARAHLGMQPRAVLVGLQAGGGDLGLRGLEHRARARRDGAVERSEEHTSELQSRQYLVCRLLLEKKKNQTPSRSH